MSEKKLKPCPFCGGEVRRGSEESKGTLNCFWCDTCDMEFTIMWHTHCDNYIKQWNTRYLDSENGNSQTVNTSDLKEDIE